ncbi:MAG: phosphotransferase [Rhodobacteraceae bacterium]|nr:phosphotransferase [Paracoccaceae bacterium]
MSELSHQNDPRTADRQDWLAAHGITAVADPLPADASPRRYFRLKGSGQLLVQVPPGDPDQPVFTRVADHLNRLCLSAPHTHQSDPDAGFYLAEDFGHRTYSTELLAGRSEAELYTAAIDTIIHLHKAADATDIALPDYDGAFLLSETLIFADWFAPRVNPAPDTDSFRDAFARLWAEALHEVADDRSALVLRDFHLDNLIHLPARDGLQSCGLIDVQGARIGAPEYDLASLLQDARRDLAPGLEEAILKRYLSAIPQDDTAFRTRYALLAAQRHTKIAGLFIRLAERDGKPAYLRHLPRVLRHLDTALTTAGLTDIRALLNQHLPGWQTADFSR